MSSALRLMLLIPLFTVSAIAKLIPGDQPGLLQAQAWVGVSVAVLELGMIAALVWKPSRRRAAVLASVVLTVGAIYAGFQSRLGLPHCGCFGARSPLRVEWHILVAGAGLMLLADWVQGSASRTEGVLNA